jgi:hypothetical protein
VLPQGHRHIRESVIGVGDTRVELQRVADDSLGVRRAAELEQERCEKAVPRATDASTVNASLSED